MLGGTTSVQCLRLADVLVGLLKKKLANAGGSTWARRVRLSLPGALMGRSENSRQYLSPVWKSLRRMQEELHKLSVPGSSPGCAFAGTVAQLAEQQTFLHHLSPQL